MFVVSRETYVPTLDKSGHTRTAGVVVAEPDDLGIVVGDGDDN
jgi:hypothetical protein